MGESKFPPAEYPSRPHKVWLRVGTKAWQTQVAIDGRWIAASSIDLRIAATTGPARLIIELPLVDFEIEQLPPPLAARDD